MMTRTNLGFFPFLLLLLTTFSLTAVAAAGPTEKAGGVAVGDLWCVAKNNAEDTALQAAIDWACGAGGADCRPIQQGGSCYQPEDLQAVASYAFNDYFVKNGGAESTCDFSGTAALTSLNPGHGSCQFPSSSSLKGGNVSTVTYGSTVGLGPSTDLNSGPSLSFDSSIWSFVGSVSVVLIALL